MNNKTNATHAGLAKILTSIPSARRLPPAPTFDAFCATFRSEDIKDWASLEANLSEAYLNKELPPVSAYVCTGPSAPFVGIHAISEELACLDRTVETYFPDLLTGQTTSVNDVGNVDEFRAWYASKLDDPGFYHFVVQFGVSSDPDFVSFLWAIWLCRELSIRDFLRGRSYSPSGLPLPVGLESSFSHSRQETAWAHFCSYEGAFLCARLYELEVYHLHALHAGILENRVITRPGPFPASLRSQELNLAYAAEMLPNSGGYYGFYVPVLNDSLRRLNAVLDFSNILESYFVQNLAEAKARLNRLLKELNHSPNLAERTELSLEICKPLVAGAWGTVGIFCVVRKQRLSGTLFRTPVTSYPEDHAVGHA